MTIGEETFERYLSSQRIRNFEFERLRDGKRCAPDYTITRDREYLFDVKDFEPTEIGDGGFYDGYARIRGKIDAARKKFKEYEGWPCSLVLYNNNAPLVDIVTPSEVLGAMYGDAGVVIPINTQTGKAVGEAQPAFLGRGKMIRPGWKEPANTRISALISLRYVQLGFMRLRKYAEDSGLHGPELLMHLHENQVDLESDEKHLGVIVWENAFAAIQFPRDFFCGEYDEIYGSEDGSQPRVFAGRGVLAYEELEASLPKRGVFNLKNRKPSAEV